MTRAQTIRPRCPAPARRAGMTLIELLVVMGIITLVASIAVVAFAPMVRGRSLSSAAYALKNAVWQARTYAATHNVRAALVFDAAERRAEIHERMPNGSWSPNPVAKPLYLPGGARFSTNLPVQALQWNTPAPPLNRERQFVVLGPGLSHAVTFTPSGLLDPANSADPTHPLGTANVQIGLISPAGAGERKAVVVLFASGLAYVEDAEDAP